MDIETLEDKILKNLLKSQEQRKKAITLLEQDIELFIENPQNKYQIGAKYKLGKNNCTNRQFQELLYTKLKQLKLKVEKAQLFQQKILKEKKKEPYCEVNATEDSQNFLKVEFKDFEIKKGIIKVPNVLLIGKTQKSNQQVYLKTAKEPQWYWYHAAIRGGSLVAGLPQYDDINAAWALLFSKHAKINFTNSGKVHRTKKIYHTNSLGSFNFGDTASLHTAEIQNLNLFFMINSEVLEVFLFPVEKPTFTFKYTLNIEPSRPQDRLIELIRFLKARGYSLKNKELDQLIQIVPINWKLIKASL